MYQPLTMAKFVYGAFAPDIRRTFTGVLLVGLIAGVLFAGCQSRQEIDATGISSPEGTQPLPTRVTVLSPTAAPIKGNPSPTQTDLPTSVIPSATATQSAIFLPITADAASQLTNVATVVFPPQDLVNALAISLDNRWLAVSVGERIEVFAWQHDPSLELVPLFNHFIGAFSHSLAFSPDGQWLATASQDGHIRLWDTGKFGKETATQPREIEAHQRGANQVAFSPDSQLLASSGNDGMLRVWEVENMEQLGQVIGGTYAVPAISFAPDGQSLAIANAEFIRLRTLADERITGSFRGEESYFSLAYHPAGAQIASGNVAGAVQIWDPAQAFTTTNPIYPAPINLADGGQHSPAFRNMIWQVIYDASGGLLAAASGDGTIRLWDVRNTNLLVTLPAHAAAATSVAFSPDGAFLVTGGLDATIRVWAVALP